MGRGCVYTDEERKQIKKEYDKKRYNENNENIKEIQKKYRSTEKGIKSNRIKIWKHRGIICEDFDSVYEKYINTTCCEYCNCEFTEKNVRCLDHNHETGEIRAILCNRCNVRDVLK